MKKSVPFIIGGAVIVIALIVAFGSGRSKSDSLYTQNPTSAPSETINPGTTSSTPSSSNPGTGVSGYTMAQVATHNSQSSCWTSINGNVYDVTVWIGQHPGGAQAILSLCGKDGSAAFDGQHGGQRRPEAELASFKIGALAK